MLGKLFCAYALLVAFVHSADEKDKAAWGYTEFEGLTPPDWHKNYSICNGARQSPIDLKDFTSDEKLKPLELEGYSKPVDGLKFHLGNNGHTVFLGIEPAEFKTISLTFNGDKYYAHSFHFHWGHYDQQGSEHLLEGRAFPLEAHIIHWKGDYGNFSNALTKSDGLLVWGQFFEISNSDNPRLKNIVDHLKDVPKGGDRKNITTFALDEMIPEKNAVDHYYHYEGSLTTPGCNEVVMWVVNQEIQKVSTAQLNAFRGLRGKNLTGVQNERMLILDNFRPVQPRNGRPVYRTVVASENSGKKDKAAWGYTEFEGLTPPDWHKNYSICNDARQSPIDLKDFTYDEKLKPLELEGYSKPLEFLLTNNGHTVSLGIEPANVETISLTFNGDKYYAHSFHFHWGHYDQQGSEHLLEGRAFPLEAHIIHWKGDYGNFSNALTKSDGLLVWGQFFEISNSDNARLNKIVYHLKDVPKGDSKKITTFALDEMIPENTAVDHYYHYEGSLTTPGCNEVVMWVVNQEIQKVSTAQLNAFRGLRGNNITGVQNEPMLILDNFRPVQPRNGRPVYSTRESNTRTPESNARSVVASVASLLVPVIAYLLF